MKIYIFPFFIFFLLILPISSKSQVVNGDFEIVKPNFLPSNWGMNFTQPVVIDNETGEVSGDQILYTWCIPSMIYMSTESQSGQYAMEISNALNSTQNLVIPGVASIFNDATQDMPGWNPGVPIATAEIVNLIGFHYKFLPAGNDIAEAKVQVFDVDGNEIGTASIDIFGTNIQYQYLSEPIQYTSNAAPVYMYISFSMAKEGSTPTFGSRLIIDNVVTNSAALTVFANEKNAEITVFPSVVTNEINVDSKGQLHGALTYEIIDIEGKIVTKNTIEEVNNLYTMNVSDLSSGMYIISFDSPLGKISEKFLKQ
ncbi:MAG: T9SS type A sorting domain-containing protein [Flavobacterium sp.]